MRQFDMFEELIPKIYESPDKGKTVYARDFGSDPSTREVVKTSVQQQWNITYKNSTLTEVDMNELMMAASRGRGDWEKYIPTTPEAQKL